MLALRRLPLRTSFANGGPLTVSEQHSVPHLVVHPKPGQGELRQGDKKQHDQDYQAECGGITNVEVREPVLVDVLHDRLGGVPGPPWVMICTGSNIWNAPMNEITMTKNNDGDSIGSVILRNIRVVPAPSTLAAS